MFFKGIVFDFDGTIVPHSELLKQEAWEKLFPGNKEIINQLQYKWAGVGSRFDIIRDVLEKLGRNTDKQSIEKEAELFSLLVKDGIVAVPLDIKDALVRIAERLPVFLSSLTPQNELESLVSSLGIDVFKGVHGWTPGYAGKAAYITLIADKLDCNPGELLFIGDTESDMREAMKAGAMFVCIDNGHNCWKNDRKNIKTISHVQEVLAMLG